MIFLVLFFYSSWERKLTRNIDIDYIFNDFQEEFFIIESLQTKNLLLNSTQATLYLNTKSSHISAYVYDYNTMELIYEIEDISKNPLIDNGNQIIYIKLTNNNQQNIEIFAYSASTSTCEKKMLLSNYNSSFTISNLKEDFSSNNRNILLENGMNLCILVTYSPANFNNMKENNDSFNVSFISSLSSRYSNYEYKINNYSAFFHISVTKTDYSKNFIINSYILSATVLDPLIIAYSKQNETKIYEKPNYLLETFGLNHFEITNNEIIIQTTKELSSFIIHNDDFDYECDILEYNNQKILHFQSNDSINSAFLHGLALIKIRILNNQLQNHFPHGFNNNLLDISFMSLNNEFSSKCNIFAITNQDFSVIQEEIDLHDERNLTSYEFMDICIWSSNNESIIRNFDFNGENERFEITLKFDDNSLQHYYSNNSLTFSSFTAFIVIHSTTISSLSSFKLKQEYKSQPNVILDLKNNTKTQLLTNQTISYNSTIIEAIVSENYSHDMFQLNVLCFIIFSSLFLSIIIVSYVYNCGRDICCCCFLPCCCFCCKNTEKESHHEHSPGTIHNNTIDQSLYTFDSITKIV